MIEGRMLRRDEIATVWQIDRSESFDAIYRLVGGRLVLEPYSLELHGWPEGESDQYTPILEECFDHNGWFHGLFDGERLIAVAVLDGRFLPGGRRLQLKFFHVDAAWRGQGLGRRLFVLACDEARQRRATGLYISATPSVATIGFYLGLGCVVTPHPDPELLELEPDDIHLDCDLDTAASR
jgi:predicted N-acetyltransferase YhbS